MDASALLLLLGVLGVDFGWQPDEKGRVEYIIQIEPQLWNAMRRGEEIVSSILPEVKGVRRFRIRIGKGPLPRHTPVSWQAAPLAIPKADQSLAARPQFVSRTLIIGPAPAGSFREVELAGHQIALLPSKRSAPRRNPLLSTFASTSAWPRTENWPDGDVEHVMLKPTLESDPPRQLQSVPPPTQLAKAAKAAKALPLWILIGLSASFGLNGFLGWMWMSFYRKYRQALQAGGSP